MRLKLSDINQERIDTFWSYVTKNGTKIEYMESQCWEWTRGLAFPNGYGRYNVSKIPINAHRFSWLITYGDIPDGLQVLHSCDNYKCCRPDHLFLGTHQDNMDDKVKKNRQAKGISTGAYTHPERVRKGEENGGHKLTEIQVREIMRVYNEIKITFVALAKMFNTSRWAVTRIVRKENWKYLWKDDSSND